MSFRELFPPGELDAAQKRTRMIGFVLLYLGLQILVIIIGVMWFTIPMMFGGVADGGGAIFTGNRLDRWLVLFVYANVVMIGLTITFAATLQAITARRASPVIPKLIMLFAALTMAAGLGIGK